MESRIGRVKAWVVSMRAELARRAGSMTPCRWAAVVVALALWMGAGGMDGSSVPISPGGEVYGEPHWFVETDFP